MIDEASSITASEITASEADMLTRLAAAAAELVNYKLSNDLRGTDFAEGLRTGRSRIELQIDLPSGEMRCFCRHPQLDASIEPVFEVRFLIPSLFN